MTSSRQSLRGSQIPFPLRAGAALIGLVFLLVFAIDFFMAHEAFTPLQLIVKTYFGLAGLVLVIASLLPGSRMKLLLRPTLLTAFLFVGLVAAGFGYRLVQSLLHSDRMATFFVSIFVPTTVVAAFAFFIWRRLRPVAP